MIELTLDQFLQVLPELIAKRWDEEKLFTRPKTPILYYSNQGDANLDYVREYNIPIYAFNRIGGSVVSFPGDIGIAYITNKTGVPVEVQKLTHYLVSKNLNVTIHNNDVLVDGYKVISYDTNEIGDNYRLVVVQISINLDIELIKQICLKIMIKTPKALSDFGVTTEQVMQVLNIE